MFDIRDLMLEAAAQVQTVQMEFEKKVRIPQVKGEVAQLWRELPDEMKDKFAKERPAEYAALMETLK